MSYLIDYKKNALKSLQQIKRYNPVLYKKIKSVLEDITEHPRSGLGHPEALKGGNDMIYSRHITQKDRIIYEIHDDIIVVVVLQVGGHYNDK